MVILVCLSFQRIRQLQGSMYELILTSFLVAISNEVPQEQCCNWLRATGHHSSFLCPLSVPEWEDCWLTLPLLSALSVLKPGPPTAVDSQRSGGKVLPVPLNSHIKGRKGQAFRSSSSPFTACIFQAYGSATSLTVNLCFVDFKSTLPDDHF